MYNPIKPYKHDILKAIEQTWHTPYLSVRRGVYPSFQKKFSYSYREVDHTDGIGTKGVYHWRAGTLHEAVLDALAMNLNDLAIMGATPYKLSNHISVPKEDGRIRAIISALARECRKRNIAIVGGETSVHEHQDGLDISMTISGFIKEYFSPLFHSGDTLIGLKSSGLHSNGFTAVRKVLGARTRPEFTVPTIIYSDAILPMLETIPIRGMMHITGGAFTKLKDLLDGKADAIIEQSAKLKPHNIFHELYRRGFSNKKMYTTFNCGIGFVLAVSPKDARRALLKLPNAAIIGTIVKGDGKVRITSAFDGKVVAL